MDTADLGLSTTDVTSSRCRSDDQDPYFHVAQFTARAVPHQPAFGDANLDPGSGVPSLDHVPLVRHELHSGLDLQSPQLLAGARKGKEVALLDLPDYQSKKELQEKLLIAIREGAGFGFQ